jgi:hypothetical protein
MRNGNLAFDPDYRAYRPRSLRRRWLHAPVTSAQGESQAGCSAESASALGRVAIRSTH